MQNLKSLQNLCLHDTCRNMPECIGAGSKTFSFLTGFFRISLCAFWMFRFTVLNVILVFTEFLLHPLGLIKKKEENF